MVTAGIFCLARVASERRFEDFHRLDIFRLDVVVDREIIWCRWSYGFGGVQSIIMKLKIVGKTVEIL